MTDAHTGTGVGGNGTILRTTNGGVTFVDQPRNAEVPSEFVLKQNYPNPFNPNTTIRYQLPMQSHVKLSVFDMLGRGVVTLANEEKSPGTYTVKWDASGVASGVYFYRLQAGQFSSVQKMLLMR